MARTLNTLILRPILVLLVVSLTLGATAIYYGMSNMMTRSLDQKVALTELFLMKTTPDMMWNYDADAMAGFATSLLQDNAFTGLYFLNDKGMPFSAKLPALPKDLGRDKILKREISVDNTKVGSFILTYSTADIHQRLLFLLGGIIAGVIALITVLGGMIFLTLRTTIRPLIKLTDIFTTSANNSDLTVTIPESNTFEINLLGRALNLFSGRIRHTLQNVQELGRVVKNNAEAIGDVAVRVSDMVTNQQQASQEIALAVNDSTANLHSLNQLTQSTSHQLEHMVRLAQEADVVMNNLETTSAQIQGVLAVISAIAESTNLLALNAAIEAARAGDAGRGFAVVADEVKKLSTQTMASTAQISDTIQALKSDIGATQKQVANISEAIGGIQGNMDMVAESTERQSATMEEINSTVANFLQQFETTRNAMDESNQRVSGLMDEVEQLDANVRVFKV